MSVGAEIQPEGGAHFRVWAPESLIVEVVTTTGRVETLRADSDGYFSGCLADVAAGTQYSIRLDRGRWEGPDPASRFQLAGPLGPSVVVDPRFRWTDASWPGLSSRGQVLYEMHVGTFTPEGTWQSAGQQLPALAELGITAIELMPITEFPGAFGWSYDGSQLFAPSRQYGSPDDFRQFVDAAHHWGIGVLMDVVYNHLGAVGERLLRSLSDHYFSKRNKTEWGAAFNYDGPLASEVRAFVLENVRYWIREFHVDGYRVDATQSIVDDSARHILLDINRTAREAAGDRSILLVAENEPQHARLMHAADQDGYEFDCAWNDDFHHSAMVRLTGRSEAYYSDYRGTAEEFVACARWGYLYQGQRYSWQKSPRGTPALDLEAWRFVNYLQNHDQVANSARGERIDRLTSPGRLRAMTAALLLFPQTPLLFQGQEFAARTPFFYFNDCEQDHGAEVRAGRAAFLSQFRSLATPQMQARLPNPCDESNYRASVLNHEERLAHSTMWSLHRDLIRLRRYDSVISRQSSNEIEGATISEDAYVLRYLPPDGWHVHGEAAVLLHPKDDPQS